MSVCRKLPDGTIQKIAGHTILLDANASEIREGNFTLPATSTGQTNSAIITFTDPMPDNDYIVVITGNGIHSELDVRTQWHVTNKTATGFTASYFSQLGAPVSYHYYAWKPIKLDGYTALRNKVNNPDDTPTIDSMNLVTSDGVARAIKDAGAVWKGTQAEWNALPLAEKKTYDIALLLDNTLVKAVDRTSGTETDVANLNKIFKGTQAEWDALTAAQRNYYDIAHINGDNSVVGTVVDKVTKDDMRAVTSNAVFQERSRGMVPDGVSIDDMIGPEWVGTWNVKPETPGHKPYIGGELGRGDTWMYLEVRYYPGGTEQIIRTFDEVAYARRFCPSGSGWLNASDTMLSGHTYGGWYTYYPSGIIVRGSKNYGSELNGCKVLMGFSYGQPYLIVSNNEHPKVAGQDFVFAHVAKIQQAFWEWGHFPDEHASLCSGGITNVSGGGIDMCFNAPYDGIDSLWMTSQVAIAANKLYAKVYANGLTR